MKFRDKLIKINACSEAVEWVDKKGFKTAWKTCSRGDWMLWYVSINRKELGLEHSRLITKAKAKCADICREVFQDVIK